MSKSITIDTEVEVPIHSVVWQDECLDFGLDIQEELGINVFIHIPEDLAKAYLEDNGYTVTKDD